MSISKHMNRRKPVGKGSHSLLKGPKAKADKKVKGGKLISTKNKIRGIGRLLRKAGSDHKLKRSLEAKLSELQGSLSQHNKEELERKFAVRYHKIRFFERVKLERRIKQLEGKASRGHVLSSSELDQIQQSKENLQGERYVSILKEAADAEAQAKLDAERTRLKAVMRHQLAESALLADADEGLGRAGSPAQAQTNPDDDAFFMESDDDAHPLGDRTATLQAADLPTSQPAQTQTGLSEAPATQQSAPQSLHLAPSHSQARQLRTAKRQAVTGSQQHSQPSAKRQKFSGQASTPELGIHWQGSQLQPSQPPHTTAQQYKAVHDVSDPAAPVKRGHSPPQPTALQAARRRQLVNAGDQQLNNGRARRVPVVQQAPGSLSAASRSQALLQQLKKKYAEPQQQPRPTAATKHSKNSDYTDLQQRSDPAHSSIKRVVPSTVLQMKKSSAVTAPMHAYSTPAESNGAIKLPVRTRAEGGRKRRK